MANVLSVGIDSDKIIAYRKEFQHRGVAIEEIQPIFRRALDEGEFTFFPSVDQLLSFRPKRKPLPKAHGSVERYLDGCHCANCEAAAAAHRGASEKGYRELRAEIDRVGGPGPVESPVEEHSMKPKPKSLDEQKRELAEWVARQKGELMTEDRRRERSLTMRRVPP
jgi:hypothetical protein